MGVAAGVAEATRRRRHSLRSGTATGRTTAPPPTPSAGRASIDLGRYRDERGGRFHPEGGGDAYGGSENETAPPFLADAEGRINSRAWNTSGAKYENGGLPQRVNLTQHLALWSKQIEQQFPDPDFSGVVD